MAERGLAVDHVTIWRWVQHYAPLLNHRLRRELRRPNGFWRVDESYIKVAGSGHARAIFRIEAIRGPGPALSLPTVTLFEQHH
jgi:transposase-like protein